MIKRTGVGVEAMKQSGRRGTAGGLSQNKPDSGGDNPSIRGLYTARQRRNEQIWALGRARSYM